jgi:hypothetical protein
MPHKGNKTRDRRRRALKRGATSYLTDFNYICRKTPQRVGVVSEGDSWFAYPRKWIALGADINITHHLESKTADTDSINLLRLASNGDEAVDMTSGKQFKKLYKILKKNRDYIRLLLFSGGGNDIVGKNDMLPLLNKYNSNMGFLDCINIPRFEQRLGAIILSFKKLIDLCEDIIPNAKIVTHTYDIAEPWDQGAEFFWGLIKTKPWIFPYMKQREIPREFHLQIIEYMLKNLKLRLMELANENNGDGRLVVVDTQGTLDPGSSEDWLNEIHPTESGFKKIFLKIYGEMRKIEPNLPE